MLNDLISSIKQQNISARSIIDLSALAGGYPLAVYEGPTRTHRVGHHRFKCWYIIRQTRDLSFPQIARLFNRDHSSCVHGTQRVERWIAEGDEYHCAELLGLCRVIAERGLPHDIATARRIAPEAIFRQADALDQALARWTGKDPENGTVGDHVRRELMR